jgi:hypothetical protein
MDISSIFALSGGLVAMAISIGVFLFWMVVAYRSMRALERMASASENQSQRLNDRG